MNPPLHSGERKQTVRDLLSGLSSRDGAHATPNALLADLVHRVENPGQALAWLLAYDSDAEVRRAALLMLFHVTRDGGPATSKIARASRPVLRRAFRDPQVSDRLKLEIGPLLRYSGVEISNEQYMGAFEDFEGAVEQQRIEQLSALPACPEAVEHQLRAAGLIDTAPIDGSERGAFLEAIELGECAADHNPSVGAMMLCVTSALALECGQRGRMYSRAIERAASTSAGEALWMLEALGALPNAAGLGREARDLAAGMRIRGVRSRVPSAGPWHEGFASGFGRDGSRYVAVIRGPSTRRQAAIFRLHEEIGIRDVRCEFDRGVTAVDALRGRLSSLSWCRCDLDLVRRIIADALATQMLSGRAVPGTFLLATNLLGEEAVLPSTREPDLSAYELDRLSPGPELVAGSADLAREDPGLRLQWMTRSAYEFMDRLPPRQGPDIRPEGFEAAEINAFVEAIAAPDRERLLARMAADLEVEALGGRSTRPTNPRIARLYHGMTHEAIPFAANPFVRALCSDSMTAIRRSLRSGRGELGASLAVAGFDGSQEH